MIYLFYPSKIMGGAEFLIIRTAELLAQKGIPVCIVDIKKGWISTHIKNKSIQIKFIASRKILLNHDDILIVPASLFYKIDDYFHKSNAKVLLWVMQAYNLIISPPLFTKKNFLIKNIIEKYLVRKTDIHIKNLLCAINKNAVIAMDESCQEVFFHKYKLRYKQYLPVFINIPQKENVIYGKHDCNTIKASWLGRVDLEFKIHILKKLVQDLSNAQKSIKHQIQLYIIGDGPGLNELKEFSSAYTNIDIIFSGNVKNEHLNNIIHTIDIGFAMGTSALEFASRGTPTILLDYSYTPIKKYKYRWLFESSNYTLGRDISLLSDQQINTMRPMIDILQSVIKHKQDLATKSFMYTYHNHSETKAFQLIMEYSRKSLLTINDFYNFRKGKPFWIYITSFLTKLGA